MCVTETDAELRGKNKVRYIYCMCWKKSNLWGKKRKIRVRQWEGGRCAKNKRQNNGCSLSTEEKERRIMSKITEPWV